MTESEIKAYNNGFLTAIATNGVMKVPKPMMAIDYKSALKFMGLTDDVIVNRDEYAYHIVGRIANVNISVSDIAHVYGNTPSEIYSLISSSRIYYRLKADELLYVDLYREHYLTYMGNYLSSSANDWKASQIATTTGTTTTAGLLLRYDITKQVIFFTNHDLIHSNSLTYNGVTHTAGDLFKSASI